MKMRFIQLVVAALFLATTPPTFAQDQTLHAATDPSTLEPGDHGYRHDELHPYYQQIYNNTKCNCESGHCRPTDYRGSPSSPTGFEVKISGKWCAVPKEAWIKGTDPDIPPELRVDPAHVCGECPNPECVVINTDG